MCKKICVFLLFTVPWILLSAEDTPVKIGFLGDFSSFSREYTHNMYLAAEMAVKEMNREGGFTGRTVELVQRDGGNDPQKHYDLAVSLVTKEKVAVIIGGASSPVVLKTSEACREYKIPYLVSVGNSQSIIVENGHPYVFLFLPTSAMETKSFSIFATLMPWQRYAWIGPNYSWGHEILNDFKQHFRETGTALQWTTELWYPLGSTDFTASIKNILKNKPDALVIGLWGDDVHYFTTQAKSLHLFNNLAVFGWYTYDFTGEIGQMVPEGMWCLARGGPFNYLAEKYPVAKQFIKNFHNSYNTYPTGYTICLYDSLLAWWQAVQKIESIHPVAVAQTLKGLEFSGVRGKSTIREVDGQINCPTYFGRLVYQEEFPFAVWDSVIEVPAEKTWLGQKEVQSRQKKQP